MSVEDSTARLIQAIHQSLDQLTILWDQVHMETVSREARIECAYEHFHNLLRDIVSFCKSLIRFNNFDNIWKCLLFIKITFTLLPFEKYGCRTQQIIYDLPKVL